MPCMIPDEINCVFLFDFVPDLISPGEFLSFLNDDSFSGAEKYELLAYLDSGAFTMFTNKEYFITISQHRTPFPVGGFQSALELANTKLTFENAESCVRDNKAGTFVTVSNKPPSQNDAQQHPHLINFTEWRLGENQKLIFRKLNTARRFCQFVANLRTSTLIHWDQSNFLLQPDRFAAPGNSSPELSLFIQPFWFSNKPMVNGLRPVGVQAIGAEYIIGTALVIREAPAPSDWIYLMMMSFLQNVMDRGCELIPDGDTFGHSFEEVILVTHNKPNKKHPNGLIELTVQRSDLHGIGSGSPARQRKNLPRLLRSFLRKVFSR